MSRAKRRKVVRVVVFVVVIPLVSAGIALALQELGQFLWFVYFGGF